MRRIIFTDDPDWVPSSGATPDVTINHKDRTIRGFDIPQPPNGPKDRPVKGAWGDFPNVPDQVSDLESYALGLIDGGTL